MLRTAKGEYYEKLNKVNSTQDLWRLLKKAKTVRADSFKEFKLANGRVSTDKKENDDDLFDHFRRLSSPTLNI